MVDGGGGGGGGGGGWLLQGRQGAKDAITRLVEDIRRNGLKGKSGRWLALALLFGGVGGVYLRSSKEGPKVFCQRNEWTELVLLLLSQAGNLRAFWPGLLTANGHIATILGFLRARPGSVPSSRELLTCFDGGHFALDWYPEVAGSAGGSSKDVPIVLILHGVNGHSKESYMRHMAHLVHKRGWRAVTMTFRGCGDLSLSSPLAYSAAFTSDVDLAVHTIHDRFPDNPLFMIGFSLGANLTVKFLGENGDSVTPIVKAAVSISNPWDMTPDASHFHYWKRGRYSSMFYSLLVAFELKKFMNRHREMFRERMPELFAHDKSMISRLYTLHDIDSKITAPFWGYDSLDAYLSHASSSQYLEHVRVPLLGINALDDPFVSPEAMSKTLHRATLNPNVIMVCTEKGGHIGFGEGFSTLWAESWAERLGLAFLESVLILERAKAASPPGLGGQETSEPPPIPRL